MKSKRWQNLLTAQVRVCNELDLEIGIGKKDLRSY